MSSADELLHYKNHLEEINSDLSKYIHELKIQFENIEKIGEISSQRIKTLSKQVELLNKQINEDLNQYTPKQLPPERKPNLTINPGNENVIIDLRKQLKEELIRFTKAEERLNNLLYGRINSFKTVK